MKTLHFLFTTAFALTAMAAQAKTLEITVSDIRNDKGSILVMAKVSGQEQPVYSKAEAKAGKIVVRLEGIDAEVAEVSLFHDEDGDYKMKMGDRGPAEGYATKKCKLPEEHNAVTMKLYYPAEENL
ncbi:DUF2141 domain-containing protein [uncultured Alistipes sp.]|uniref:DUF2141 domain-containing protein n=1 Tax=uncultured Alistipes sp. TaxID=538949 RepID=UPI0025F9A6F2|nr:DUF2141 domain-containing protein [uncultured Alistipes sp.]